MKAEELRIGIYLNRNYDLGNYEDSEYRLQCVDLEVFEFIAHDADYIKNLHPIPLTEEWLFKLGFEKLSDVSFKKVGTDLNYQIIISNTGNGFRTASAITQRSIETVHQLQNIYFALTGDELSVGTK